MKDSITSRIFKIIEENDLTQTKLAQTLGITRNNLSEWKTGRSEPSPKIILKFLYHFPEVDANWLIRGENSNKQVKNYNISTGRKTVVEENSATLLENKHLKELVKEKDEQIKLLKELLKR